MTAELPLIEDIDLRNKRVLLRADLNVTFEPGTTVISDDSRIHASITTVELLRRRGARVIYVFASGSAQRQGSSRDANRTGSRTDCRSDWRGG